MKKKKIVLLVCLTAICLAACSGNKIEENRDDTGQVSTEETIPVIDTEMNGEDAEQISISENEAENGEKIESEADAETDAAKSTEAGANAETETGSFPETELIPETLTEAGMDDGEIEETDSRSENEIGDFDGLDLDEDIEIEIEGGQKSAGG